MTSWFSKVDAGEMSFEKTPFKMDHLLNRCFIYSKQKNSRENLKLVKEYDSNIPTVLVGDPIRLHQIILNLVSNTVKFTSEGKITVSVRLVDEDSENVTQFSVIPELGFQRKS
jgi:signal transduction histidine kinase